MEQSPGAGAEAFCTRSPVTGAASLPRPHLPTSRAAAHPSMAVHWPAHITFAYCFGLCLPDDEQNPNIQKICDFSVDITGSYFRNRNPAS